MFKHPISAGVCPDMAILRDIYDFRGPPTFPPENATFGNGAPMVFPKSSRKSQILCLLIVDIYKPNKC